MLLTPLIAITLSSLRRDPAPADAAPVVRVTGGQVVGTVKDGVGSYRGIPFAAPPVGANRWRAPQPVIAWQGVRRADAYGPAPMQSKGAALVFGGGLTTSVSEDCLYLNVWTPARKPGAKLPVLVWIYGGAFKSGMTGSPFYDGASLARRGVVVVSVAYRVGAFGFLAHPELSRESGHGSGNYGLMDQIAGLRWVRQNIGAFGGDASNVTIFGESAGGESTSILAASPAARGLFHKVISQSGSFFGPVRDRDQAGVGPYTQRYAESQGTAFLHGLGAETLAAARTLPADKIEAADSGVSFWPDVDGAVIRGDAYRLYQAGRFNDTPILVGTNSDDGGMFSPAQQTVAEFEVLVRRAFGAQADAVLAVYPHATDAQARASGRQLVGDFIFAWGTWSWARLQSQKGKGAAYVYYFDRYPSKTPDGAGHGAEVAYVFGFVHPQFGLSRPEDVAFSDTMQRYWTNFAKTGNPNGPGLVPWSRYREPDARVLNFGSDIRVQPVPHLRRLQALEDGFARQR